MTSHCQDMCAGVTGEVARVTNLARRRSGKESGERVQGGGFVGGVEARLGSRERKWVVEEDAMANGFHADLFRKERGSDDENSMSSDDAEYDPGR